mmetsp:Transcript_12956/g.38118  ORF Transcript_12956/g.38118 Transcript_12956/m.38118 type:complete len:292 (+) Transcript_12956:1313-2188(+)
MRSVGAFESLERWDVFERDGQLLVIIFVRFQLGHHVLVLRKIEAIQRGSGAVAQPLGVAGRLFLDIISKLLERVDLLGIAHDCKLFRRWGVEEASGLRAEAALGRKEVDELKRVLARHAGELARSDIWSDGNVEIRVLLEQRLQNLCVSVPQATVKDARRDPETLDACLLGQHGFDLVDVLESMPVWLGRDGPGIGDEDYRELALRLVIERGRRGNSKDLVDCWLAMSPVASLDGHVVDIVGLQRELSKPNIGEVIERALGFGLNSVVAQVESARHDGELPSCIDATLVVR